MLTSRSAASSGTTRAASAAAPEAHQTPRRVPAARTEERATRQPRRPWRRGAPWPQRGQRRRPARAADADARPRTREVAPLTLVASRAQLEPRRTHGERRRQLTCTRLRRLAVIVAAGAEPSGLAVARFRLKAASQARLAAEGAGNVAVAPAAPPPPPSLRGSGRERRSAASSAAAAASARSRAGGPAPIDAVTEVVQAGRPIARRLARRQMSSRRQPAAKDARRQAPT